MLNLFIAVVIEGFSSVNKEHTGVVTHKDYVKFVDAWLNFDHDASGWISLEDLVFFMFILESPLGRKDMIDQKYMEQLVTNVEKKLQLKG